MSPTTPPSSSVPQAAPSSTPQERVVSSLPSPTEAVESVEAATKKVRSQKPKSKPVAAAPPTAKTTTKSQQTKPPAPAAAVAVDTLTAARDKSVNSGKKVLKAIQTKIGKKATELKKLLAEQERTVEQLKSEIRQETDKQAAHKGTYDKAMEDINRIQKSIQEAEVEYAGLQADMEEKRSTTPETIRSLQAELQRLQEETDTKHKAYEEAIQFFF